MIYNVNVRETLERIVPVKADSEEDAISQVQIMYNQGKVELTAEDMKEVDFATLED